MGAFTKPSFHPRTELTDRFMKYTDSFSKRANERGMDLQWIGVGTWKASNDLVNVRHLEAWRLNLDNAMHSSDEALAQVADEACLNEKLRLIRTVPLDVYNANKVTLVEKEKRIESLLQNFWEQMGSVLDFYYTNNIQNEEVEKLEGAISKIEKLLNIPAYHVPGGGSFSKVKRKASPHAAEDAPPAPSSKLEEQQYRVLLGKLGGNYKTVEAMIANEQRRFPNMTREEAIVRIVKRLERYGK